MSVSIHCPTCACTQALPAHALLRVLRDDDLDAALQLGLLDAQPCPECDTACNARLITARDARRVALAARERYRSRDARLQRRKTAREAARAPATTAASATPALPNAAADALARALAKARGPASR